MPSSLFPARVVRLTCQSELHTLCSSFFRRRQHASRCAAAGKFSPTLQLRAVSHPFAYTMLHMCLGPTMPTLAHIGASQGAPRPDTRAGLPPPPASPPLAASALARQSRRRDIVRCTRTAVRPSSLAARRPPVLPPPSPYPPCRIPSPVPRVPGTPTPPPPPSGSPPVLRLSPRGHPDPSAPRRQRRSAAARSSPDKGFHMLPRGGCQRRSRQSPACCLGAHADPPICRACTSSS